MDPHHFGKLDPDPHHFGKLDPDPHQSEKQDLDLMRIRNTAKKIINVAKGTVTT